MYAPFIMKNKLINPLSRLTKIRPNATMMLFVAAVLAVVVANSPWSGIYGELLDYPVLLQIGDYNVFSHHGHTMTLLEFVNDALMAVFFFVVGLEIKQEILVGELSDFRKAILPVIGAVGGMIAPVLFYLLVCHSGDEIHGAAIPMATDIAFALAALTALGSRVPPSLKAFLTALAVVDDIGGIIVIAVFYSSHISFILLGIAVALLLGLYLLGRIGVVHRTVYYLGGVIVWTLFVGSGIHATIAGVLLAFTVPVRSKVNMHNLRSEMRMLFNMMPEDERLSSKNVMMLSHGQISLISSLKRKAAMAIPPVQEMESELSSVVNYFILPLFAFVNAGVVLGGVTADQMFGVPLAIVLGLFAGKTLGIFSSTSLFIKSGLGKMPKGMTYHNLLALSVLGGIGFTVALFLASLSFKAVHPDYFNQAKMGIFAGSILSGIVGFLWLRHVLNKEHQQRGKADKPVD